MTPEKLIEKMVEAYMSIPSLSITKSAPKMLRIVLSEIEKGEIVFAEMQQGRFGADDFNEVVLKQDFAKFLKEEK